MIYLTLGDTFMWQEITIWHKQKSCRRGFLNCSLYSLACPSYILFESLIHVGLATSFLEVATGFITSTSPMENLNQGAHKPTERVTQRRCTCTAISRPTSIRGFLLLRRKLERDCRRSERSANSFPRLVARREGRKEDFGPRN